MLPAIMEEALVYANTHFGQYPYPVYSFIQGGDGGMEYPMATLITGHRNLVSLVGVSIHEMMHSWYQMVLGFNVSLYAWMDEGFTQYTSELITEHLKEQGMIPGDPDPNPFTGFYRGYENLTRKGIEEPLSTHADHYDFNQSYGIAAYIKGAVFLHQLQYVIGRPAFEVGMRAFYDRWQFRHPDDVAFIRVMEQVAGLELDWYREYMVNSVKTVDYAVDTLEQTDTGVLIRLSRQGGMPMPVDVAIELNDGSKLYYTIPLDLMRGHKSEVAPNGTPWLPAPDWHWVNPYYGLSLDTPIGSIRSIEIDPTDRLADFGPENNTWPRLVE